MEITLSDKQLKQVVKASLVELLQERDEVMTEIVREALEDCGMEQAIEEGMDNKPVSRDAIFKVFN